MLKVVICNMYKAINKYKTCIAKIVLKISIFECSILQQLHDCLRVNKLLMMKKIERENN